MILYLDTSSLLKLYFQEEGTAAIRLLVQQARTLSSSMIGYVETCSGLVRARRGGRLTEGDYTDALREFERDWASYLIRNVTESLVREAARLAERYYLRGLDAIHLASAVSLQRELGESITFSAADARLMSAAGDAGLLPAT